MKKTFITIIGALCIVAASATMAGATTRAPQSASRSSVTGASSASSRFPTTCPPAGVVGKAPRADSLQTNCSHVRQGTGSGVQVHEQKRPDDPLLHQQHRKALLSQEASFPKGSIVVVTNLGTGVAAYLLLPDVLHVQEGTLNCVIETEASAAPAHEEALAQGPSQVVLVAALAGFGTTEASEQLEETESPPGADGCRSPPGRLERLPGKHPDQPFDEYRFRNWRWFWDFGGGVLTDLMVHWIDVAHWFLEADRPLKATSFGDHFASKGVWQTPDTIQCILEYPNNVQAHFEGTFSNATYGAMITFMGTDGTLYIDRGRYEITPENGKGKPEALILGTNPRKGADFYDKPDGELLHLTNWVECIRSRQKPNAPAEAGVSAAAAAHLGNRAYRTGQVADWKTV